MTQVVSAAHRVEVIASSGSYIQAQAAATAAGTFRLLSPASMPGFNTGAVSTGNARVFQSLTNGSTLEYGNRGLWYPVNKELYFQGGEHSGAGSQVPCDETRFVKYVDATNTWSVLTDSCRAGVGSNFPGGVAHPYNQYSINTSNGDIYMHVYFSLEYLKWTRATQTWSSLGNRPGSSQISECVEYFPQRNSFVIINGSWGVYEYALPTGPWTLRAYTTYGSAPVGTPQLFGMGDYDTQGAYSAVHQAVFFGGGGGGRAFYRYNADGTFQTLTNCPTSFSISQGNPPLGCIFVSDPVSGRLLLWDYLGTAYEYNPATVPGVWRTTGFNAPFVPMPEGGISCVIATPISDYGVILFCGLADSMATGFAYLYKHSTS